MDDIFSRIQIIPIANCLAHEGIIQKWADQIASNIKDQGIMKNPVIVTRQGKYYVVLDGMHRFAALKKLGIRNILACVIDYFSPKILLEGWDAFVFEKIDLKPLFKGYSFVRASNLKEAKSRVLKREALLAVGSRRGNVFVLEKSGLKKKDFVDELCLVNDRLDRMLSAKEIKVVYVDNSLTLDDFASSNAQIVIFRPQFTKEEVIQRTLHKKTFPPKSTRHLIPERPLRVDVDLALLRANIDGKTKNRLLQDHLRWCYENNRMRFYPESVYIFAD
ncbi:MAG: hypothetical protein A2W61_01810 [Deltaproteobacteria bacterium RIFCSPLOWO2_01_44_7]|nr:MAG: hypothetical protein A2712_08550 [Deltaproteobacteria bacterium RIFCSPHIGHO2_01_FULL_43_49]OGQ14612.1 MAG: hypothetical protein A3D22_08450 [Deltaproteobacteria bacterium RIFCSPHIGHO2_02_FULL_44_53]OGQ27998.1 MAG: hypothetical protein A3D98_07160 [Deltaproteobacteria bacterium RIFCSPHIGHO2_12_FULL_44_21]OGQ31210.1 MAG: hypothetical protein A2979_07210 [Deltaproteobacteria bacterium RIFCSPLOWO2_01_FULL_45_74]OGQ40421.1 MAG: hypothetical protein A2W61_01810 [Deltaproteobacteria bacterium 